MFEANFWSFVANDLGTATLAMVIQGTILSLAVSAIIASVVAGVNSVRRNWSEVAKGTEEHKVQQIMKLREHRLECIKELREHKFNLGLDEKSTRGKFLIGGSPTATGKDGNLSTGIGVNGGGTRNATFFVKETK
jgi:hypothetical protein